MAIKTGYNYLICDACGSRSLITPPVALIIHNWTTVFDGHLCGACSVIHLMVGLMQLIKGQVDCGTSMSTGIPTTFAFDVIPDEWSSTLRGYDAYLNTFKSIPARH